MLKSFKILSFILLIIFQVILTHRYVPFEEKYKNYDRNYIQLYAIGKGLQKRVKTSSYLGYYSHQAAIEENGELYCGGTIITLRIIISAAHCFYNKSAKNLSVRIGTEYREKCGKIYNIHSFRNHPQFRYSITNKNSDPPNDISIVIVTNEMDSNLVKPAVLPKSDKSYQLYKLYVSGWGSLNETLQPVLKYTKILLWKKKKCFDIDPYSEKKLCGKSLKLVEGACYGDSGGPLVDLRSKNDETVLVGVISGGIEGCANPKSIVFFMDVLSYKDWIMENVNEIEKYLIPYLDSDWNQLIDKR